MEHEPDVTTQLDAAERADHLRTRISTDVRGWSDAAIDRLLNEISRDVDEHFVDPEEFRRTMRVSQANEMAAIRASHDANRADLNRKVWRLIAVVGWALLAIGVVTFWGR